jgi:hypothetical protein
MIKFKTFITERYINLIGDDPKKHEYKHEVHNLLKKSYEKIGGIHGSGFESPDDMVKKVHMWKLAKKDGKIVSAVMYKEKQKPLVLSSAFIYLEEINSKKEEYKN